jgi:hypothetical protein
MSYPDPPLIAQFALASAFVHLKKEEGNNLMFGRNKLMPIFDNPYACDQFTAPALDEGDGPRCERHECRVGHLRHYLSCADITIRSDVSTRP